MRERLAGIWGAIKEFWDKTSRKMRIVYLASLAGILLISLMIAMILNYTNYITLYDNLTVTESAQVLASLQEMGVQGKLESGKVLVPEKDEMRVRMQLAMKGYPDSGFDYSIFEKGSGLTMTQFEKNQYAVYQTQERLQATIRTFPEVQSAIVTISMPEKNTFVLQEDVVQPSASVKIQKKPGRKLTAEQVTGILNIVKNSIPGLTEENISISDESGDLKSVILYDADGNNSKLGLTEQVNETIRRRVMTLLAPVYGAEKVVVAVNAVLDTDARVTDETTYIPFDRENPRNNPLDYSEHMREGDGQNPVVEGVPGANDNVDVPQYTTQDGAGEENRYYSTHDIYDYLVSSVRNQIVKEGLYITDLTSASVIIDASSLPDGERDQIIDLVASASGINRDNISVQNIRFTPQAIVEQQPDLRLRQVIIFSGIGLLLLSAIFIAVIIILSRRKKVKEQEEAEVYAQEQASLLELMNSQSEDFQPIVLVETQEQKLRAQIKDLADSDPEIVAQLIKTWLINA